MTDRDAETKRHHDGHEDWGGLGPCECPVCRPDLQPDEEGGS